MRRAARTDRPLLSATQRLHALTASIDLLLEGELEIVGRLTDASNATFLCRIASAADEDQGVMPIDVTDPAMRAEHAGSMCVYKPVRGERPLDDFPDGTLARREVAAFHVSEMSGWQVVPPTVMLDGPFGEGMVQAWIETDPDVDVVELVTRGDERLRSMCLFDALVNNADRKAGHLLPTADGRVLGVDHGICFSADPKLRTVLWGWRGDEIADDELAVIRNVCSGIDGQLGAALRELLSVREVRATQRRAEELLREGRFPQPDPFRPAIPWPPF
jgi:uncharacterized repeat protein (TIGR03843 family)